LAAIMGTTIFQPSLIDQVISHYKIVKELGRRADGNGAVYVAVDTAVMVEKREGMTLSFSLNPVPTVKISVLQLRLKPSGTIYIDDSLRTQEARGENIIELAAGPHKIRVEHPTLGIWEKTIAVAPNGTNKLTIDFTKTVTLTVASEPVWAFIFVEGKFTGQETSTPGWPAYGAKATSSRVDLNELILRKTWRNRWCSY
jgi:hypothetical protein